jgi:hypothetical protein
VADRPCQASHDLLRNLRSRRLSRQPEHHLAV